MQNDAVLEEDDDELLEEWVEYDASFNCITEEFLVYNDDSAENDIVYEEDVLEKRSAFTMDFDGRDFDEPEILEEWLENEVDIESTNEEHLEESLKTCPELDDCQNCYLAHLEIDQLLEQNINESMDEQIQCDEFESTEKHAEEMFEQQLAKKDAEIERLKRALERSRRRQIMVFDLKAFEGNDSKTRHFTGLPNFISLKILYDFVHAGILVSSRVLSKEQVFVMVLIRLRLNLCFKTIGYLFNVSTATACKYFYSGLYSLYKQLQGLIKWPEKELLDYYIPLKFKKVFSSSITSIIDCFEIFSEKPSTKDATLKMYSNYKSHYTTKMLISITPFGTISYISKPYTGRTSDKQITEASGYLDKIQSDDLILADRGFSIQKFVQDKNATLRVPDSSNRKRQLSSVAVERTRALASVRNEVERSIGALRGKYTLLKGPVSINMMNHEHNGVNVLYMAVTVCCALVNLCPSIIK